MKRTILSAVLLAACPLALPASPEPTTGTESPHAAAPKKRMKMKAKKPVKMDAPMKTPMAKEGTMMGDVKDSAAKKDAAMREMMRQEERTMPPADTR